MIFPDKQLAIRLESSLAEDMREYVETFQQLFPDQQTAYQTIGGGIVICMGSNYLNLAVGMGFDTTISASDFDDLDTFFQQHHITPSIEICPFVNPRFLNLVSQHGYHLLKFTTAYIHTLADIPFISTDIQVKPIDDTQRELWVNTVMDIDAGNTTTDTHLAQAVTHRPHTTCFLATRDDIAVGASALSIRHNIATLYFTSTRQAYRGHGVQTAMIHARLAYARAQGCELAFATTIPGNNSMRNLLRAGFQVAYTRYMMGKDSAYLG
mgnify:CR=1 FL=1